MAQEKPENSHNVDHTDHDDEYVVPHMHIGCLVNSMAYMDVLRNPAILLQGFQSLPASSQKSVLDFCNGRLKEIENKNKMQPPSQENPSPSSEATSSSFEVEDQPTNGDSTDEGNKQSDE
ncbi:unnamed protein product [Hymenolepis diminuta]|uniref:STI1 domain-containing protein n=1 Tax=Hymenolepis diminuta TaxID=6216 RepID=A0A0R3SX16_HYMDI|nr:unnamed protein product [Hymenolepis diminuta]VUZ50547.1 unnamed protein product [Hymenolepis diminuta]